MREPYYSSVRINPGGRQIGIAGERENERALQETVHHRAAQSARDGQSPLPPSDVHVEVTGASARATWEDRSTDEAGFLLILTSLRNGEQVRADRLPTGTESAILAGLEPGRYVIRLYSHYASHGLRTGISEPVSTSFLVSGAEPSAPSNVKVALDDSNPFCRQATATWTEHFRSEEKESASSWSEVRVYLDDRLHRRHFVRAGTGSLSFGPSQFPFDCVEDGIYGFRVYAHSFGGRSQGSDTVTVEGPRGGPPAAGFDLSLDCDEDLCIAWTGVPVKFENESSGTVEHVRWDFGDGMTSPERKPSYTWTTPGFFRVVLTAYGDGQRSTVSRDILVRSSDPAGTCEPDLETLCLRDSRYTVQAEWSRGDSKRGPASVAYAGTNDSGVFWFFGRENWEMLIKVLDGCAVNGNVWVFGASTTDLGYSIKVTDTVTGRRREYRNEPGKPAPAITDTDAFTGGCGDSAGVAAQPVTFTGEAADEEPWDNWLPRQSIWAGTQVGQASHDACADARWALCPQDGRYEVVVWWRTTRNGAYTLARRAPARTRDSGLYSFFDEDNWEMLIKVLDGCAVNGQHWVYAASATDLGFQIRVTDTETHATWMYTKQPGKPAEAVTASEAFPDACQP